MKETTLDRIMSDILSTHSENAAAMVGYTTWQDVQEGPVLRHVSASSANWPIMACGGRKLFMAPMDWGSGWIIGEEADIRELIKKLSQT